MSHYHPNQSVSWEHFNHNSHWVTSQTEKRNQFLFILLIMLLNNSQNRYWKINPGQIFRSAISTVSTVGIFTQHQVARSKQMESAKSLSSGTDQKSYFLVLNISVSKFTTLNCFVIIKTVALWNKEAGWYFTVFVILNLPSYFRFYSL